MNGGQCSSPLARMNDLQPLHHRFFCTMRASARGVRVHNGGGQWESKVWLRHAAPSSQPSHRSMLCAAVAFARHDSLQTRCLWEHNMLTTSSARSCRGLLLPTPYSDNGGRGLVVSRCRRWDAQVWVCQVNKWCFKLSSHKAPSPARKYDQVYDRQTLNAMRCV